MPGLVVLPSGGYELYVPIGSEVAIVNLRTNTVIDTIPVAAESPGQAVFTPNDAFVYVTDPDSIDSSNGVYIINTASQTIIDSLAVGNNPYGIALTPNGDFAYIGLQNSPLAVVNTTTNTVVDMISVGNHTFGCAVTPGWKILLRH